MKVIIVVILVWMFVRRLLVRLRSSSKVIIMFVLVRRLGSWVLLGGPS